MLITDSETLMILVLPLLTPKQAAPLIFSCKKMKNSQKKAWDTMSPVEYARFWAQEYASIWASVRYSVGSIGNCMVGEFPPDELLKTTIVLVDPKLYKDNIGSIPYRFVYKIRFFFKKKNSGGKRVFPIVSWSKTL